MSEDRSQLHELPAPLPEGERVIWRGRPTLQRPGPTVVPRQGGRHLCRPSPGLEAVVVLVRRSARCRYGRRHAVDRRSRSGRHRCFCLLLAWLFRRATAYTLTDKRVLFQFGVALPMSMNIPLSKIASAELKTRRDGTGDIPIKVIDTKRVSYLLLWPHIRPWRLDGPEPTFVSIPDAAAVAAKFAEALAALPASSPQPNVAASNSGPSGDPLGNPPAPVAA